MATPTVVHVAEAARGVDVAVVAVRVVLAVYRADHQVCVPVEVGTAVAGIHAAVRAVAVGVLFTVVLAGLISDSPVVVVITDTRKGVNVLS